MTITNKKTNKGKRRKLILVLVLALAITAIIPLGVMGSSDVSIAVKFMVDEKVYDEVKVPVDENESTHYFDKSLYPDDPEGEEGYIFEGWSDGTNIYNRDSQEQFKITIPDVSLDAVFTEDESAEKNKEEKQEKDESEKSEKTTDEAIEDTDENDGAENKSDNNEETANDDKAENNQKTQSLGNAAPVEDTSVEVSFYLDANDETPYYTEKVERDTLVENWPDNPQEKEGVKFLYWYDAEAAEANGTKTPYFSKTMITEDTKLVAEFNNGHIVTFYDTDGTVLSEVAVDDNSPVNVTTKKVALDAGEAVDYWYSENEETPYNFDTAVTQDIKLYPHVTKNSVVYFVTKGTYEKPQVVKKNGYAVKPSKDPVRAGYTFKGWSKSPLEYDEFNFANEKITEETTYIYANWESVETTYTINFWNEKPNIAGDPWTFESVPGNYELVHSVTQKAKTDTYIQLSEQDASKLYNAAGQRVVNLLNYSTFQNADYKGVNGDGSTVINVSYKRTPFTFNINPRASVANQDKTADMVINGQTVTYAAVELKLGQDISKLWPSRVNRNDGKNLGLINFGGYAGIVNPNLETPLSVSYINHFMNGNYGTYKKPTKTTGNVNPQWYAVISFEQRWYYLEDLDQENSTGVEHNNGKSVKKYSLNQRSAMNQQTTNIQSQLNSYGQNALKNWSGKEIEGFVTVIEKNSNIPANRKIEKATPADIGNGGFTQEEYDQNGGGKNLFVFRYFMERQEYDLKLVVNGGTMGDDAKTGYKEDVKGDLTKTYKYQQQLNNIGQPTKEDYVFDGWYTDPTFVESSRVTIGSAKVNGVQNIKNMPSSNLTLYARFVGADAQIGYKDGDKTISTKDTNIGKYADPAIGNVNVDGISYGSLAIDQEVPGRGIFKGWFYQPAEDMDEVEFYKSSFSVAQTKYVVSAKWAPVPYKISYFDDETKQSLNNGDYDLTIRSNKNTLAKNQTTLPKISKEDGYTYTWKTENGNLFRSNTEVKGDTNVYLAKTANKYNVNFNLNGGAGTTPAAQSIQFGNKAVQPTEIPERTGYIFDGWYTTAVVPAKDIDGTIWNFDENTVGSADMTLYAGWKAYEYTVKFDVNIEDVAAIDDMKVESPNTTIQSMPINPEKAGYEFKGWNTLEDGSGNTFDENTIISENITVYGQWEEKAAPIEPEDEEEKLITPSGVTPDLDPQVDPEEETALGGPGTSNPPSSNTDGTGGGTAGGGTAADSGSVLSDQAASRAISEGLVPSTSIGDTEVPLYSNGLFGSWALLNLILAIAGGLLALAAVIRSLVTRRNKDEEEKTDEDKKKERKTRLSWLIASLVFAIGGIVLFLVTQDITKTMVLVDMWTVVNGLLAALTLISLVFVSKKNKQKNTDDNAAVTH